MTRKEQVEQLFPTGQLLPYKKEEEGRILLPLEDDTWLSIEEDSLTERERCLLELFLSNPYQTAENPWFNFLHEKGPLPTQLDTLQLIHVHIWSESDEDGRMGWLEMMHSLLPNKVDVLQLTSVDYVFLLEQGLLFDVKEVLESTLSAIEIDFGLRMSVLVGSMWPQLVQEDWPALFQAERNLFEQWRENHNQACLIPFGQLYLWSGLSHKLIDSRLKTLLDHHQMEEIILALWQAGAVLTKAAQMLYIHRNTLQYRLDKWQDWTGLQVKELTDLALCYGVLLRQKGLKS